MSKDQDDGRLPKRVVEDKNPFFRESLKGVLQKVDLDLATLASQGCYCCDVGAGAEIFALLPLNPKILIASEPQTLHWERAAINSSLQALALQHENGFELIRTEPEPALRHLTSRKIKFGLITWLRIHPLKIKAVGISNFVKKTNSLLISGGAVVASVGFRGFEIPESPELVDVEEVEGDEVIFRAGALIQKSGNFRVGYSFSPIGSPQSAGGVFLIATKVT